jgi:hypothetical protein
VGQQQRIFEKKFVRIVLYIAAAIEVDLFYFSFIEFGIDQ